MAAYRSFRNCPVSSRLSGVCGGKPAVIVSDSRKLFHSQMLSQRAYACPKQSPCPAPKMHVHFCSCRPWGALSFAIIGSAAHLVGARNGRRCPNICRIVCGGRTPDLQQQRQLHLRHDPIVQRTPDQWRCKSPGTPNQVSFVSSL